MRQSVLVCISFLSAACINTNVQRLDDTIRPARSPESIAVLLEKPREPYTVIAVIESRGETVFDSFDDIRNKMIAEAGRLGGEALVLGTQSTDSEFIFTGTAMIKSETRRMTGVVIVYNRGDWF